MQNIIDTHCHPYLNKTKDTNQVIENFFADKGKAMVVIGTDNNTNIKAINLAKKYDGVYATIGIHPCDVYGLDLGNTIEKLEKLYLENKNKIVGIGETGLDYYWMLKESDNQEEIQNKKQIQKDFFIKQISLAKKYNLPFIIHNRDSKDDVLKILKEQNYKNFIFHCYSEDLEYAKQLINFAPNCFISFSGIVTFKNAKDVQEAAQKIDIKNILAETDAPYLTPTPYRGKEENEPIFTRYVIEFIAELRGEKIDDIYDEIYNNSKNAFDIDI